MYYEESEGIKFTVIEEDDLCHSCVLREECPLVNSINTQNVIINGNGLIVTDCAIHCTELDDK